MMEGRILYVGSTGVVEVAGLRNEIAGVLVSDAAVTAELRSEPSGTEPLLTLTLSAVGGAAGTYRAIVPHDAAVERGRRYTLRLTVVAGELRSYKEILLRTKVDSA